MVPGGVPCGPGVPRLGRPYPWSQSKYNHPANSVNIAFPRNFELDLRAFDSVLTLAAAAQGLTPLALQVRAAPADNDRGE